mmetsp:Transcript_41814/g.61458  ORF Transcript_41814/g.61458 Transcript_41814/m.61458 type:complete len:270 (-) Transcript_41814:526-1335(-)
MQQMPSSKRDGASDERETGMQFCLPQHLKHAHNECHKHHAHLHGSRVHIRTQLFYTCVKGLFFTRNLRTVILPLNLGEGLDNVLRLPAAVKRHIHSPCHANGNHNHKQIQEERRRILLFISHGVVIITTCNSMVEPTILCGNFWISSPHTKPADQFPNRGHKNDSRQENGHDLVIYIFLELWAFENVEKVEFVSHGKALRSSHVGCDAEQRQDARLGAEQTQIHLHCVRVHIDKVRSVAEIVAAKKALIVSNRVQHVCEPDFAAEFQLF